MQQSWKLSWRKSPWVRISVPPPWIIINLRQLRFFCTKRKHSYHVFMKIFILSYIGAFIAMLPLDAFWLYFANSRVYKPRIGHLLASQPDFLAAGIFYLLYILGWVVFVILPAIRDNASLLSVFSHGALFGLVAYATFDLTSQALLRDWSWQVTIIDLVWGSLLTAIVCFASFVFTRYFL
jgi:uncharacterized membrane protein